jgi:hypothetical protein
MPPETIAKRTAEILGINRKTLYRMAARFEIAFG